MNWLMDKNYTQTPTSKLDGEPAFSASCNQH